MSVTSSANLFEVKQSTGGLAASFDKLGLKPGMVSKAIPIVTNYVTKTGGADVGKLLAGALK